MPIRFLSIVRFFVKVIVPLSLVRTALLKVVMLTFSCLALPQEAWSAKSKIDTLLHRVFSYPQTIEIRQVADTASYAYMKSSLRVNKRNVLLMAIPTMYMVVHGGLSLIHI